MSAASAAPTISDEQLPELLDLLRDADSVELKLTVPESGQYAAAGALRLDPLDAQIRQVYFFDTPDLALNHRGVVLRARRVQRRGGDSVVKLRPVIPKEISKTLRAFLAEHAPRGPALDELSVLGPILVLKLKFEPEGFERRLVAELWMYPDGSRVLELSTKCEPTQAVQTAAETRAFLSQRGVELTGQQQAKTTKALEFFAAGLR
jgi:hypothetical protein